MCVYIYIYIYITIGITNVEKKLLYVCKHELTQDWRLMFSVSIHCLLRFSIDSLSESLLNPGLSRSEFSRKILLSASSRAFVMRQFLKYDNLRSNAAYDADPQLSRCSLYRRF